MALTAPALALLLVGLGFWRASAHWLATRAQFPWRDGRLFAARVHAMVDDLSRTGALQ